MIYDKYVWINSHKWNNLLWNYAQKIALMSVVVDRMINLFSKVLNKDLTFK